MKTVNKNISKKDYKTDYLIIGNSAASLAAAESIRRLDSKSKIDVFTHEGHLNYSKPLISYYLAGKVGLDRIYFKDKKFYLAKNIKLNLNARAASLDAKRQLIKTDDGQNVSYYKLLIASGGNPIIPQIKVKEKEAAQQKQPASKENLAGSMAQIKGIFTLTTLDDAAAIKKYINDNNIKSASILGGGLIGLKAAEAFLELGIKITVIELSQMVLSASYDETASAIISKRIEKSGSNILTNSTITEIYTHEKKITGYKLRSGKIIACSLLVVAIGVRPNAGFTEGSGIKLDNGIVVDNMMGTSVKNIYAAGDVVSSFEKISGQQKNIAIWPLAVKQGSIAGENMAGGKAYYTGGFYMNSIEILGVPVISLGLSSLSQNTSGGIEVYKSYDPEKGIYRKIIIKDEKVIGAILAGSIERAGIYAGLINNDVDISGIKENLAKEDFGIIQLPADYRKHLVVGEGIEV